MPNPVQAPAPAVPPAPTAPAPPPAAVTPAVTVDPSATADMAPTAPRTAPQQQLSAPLTGAALAGVEARRAALGAQLRDAQSRRDELSRQLQNPMVGGVDARGIEAHLLLVDRRILDLERDLDATNRQLAGAPASLRGTSAGVPFRPGPTYTQGFGLGIGSGLALSTVLALGYARLRRSARRSRRDAGPPAPASAADSARLARVEQAVEAVAIEVERISEGQRFVTQLLAERRDEARIAAPAFADAPDAPDAPPR